MKFSHLLSVLLAMLITLGVGWLVWSQSSFRFGQLSYQSMRSVLLLSEGRITPFDTYARKFALNMTGTETPRLEDFGQNLAQDGAVQKPQSKMNAMEFLMLLISRDDPMGEKVFKIDHPELKTSLGIDRARSYVAFQEVFGNPILDQMREVYQNKKDNKVPLDPIDEAFLDLNTQLNLFTDLIQGTSLTFYPQTADKYTNWIGLTEIGGLKEPNAVKIHEGFQQLLHINYFANHPKKEHVHSQEEGDKQTRFNQASMNILEAQKAVYQADATVFEKTPYELTYNRLKPFRVAWVVYLISLLAGIFAILFKLPFFSNLGLGLMWTGFLSHTFGLALRTYILDRPPVGNMYESVVFVGWCVILFFLLLFSTNKKPFLRNSSVLAALLIMVMADLLPMSQELGMLEAVLRSNYWLTIHVLVIVASYGAFALGCGLGHYYLLRILVGTPEQSREMKELADSIYQTMKVGVILIGAGTILGGVWANESWGRFWGWDPKETWALISFLGYLALLHGRKANWFGDFGTAVGSLVGFLLILMTWYGVNFVLGIGLHSYGFGSGGTHYALAFTLAEIIFLAVIWFRRPAPILKSL